MEGKKNTDKWFPVILTDDTDFKSPEPGKAFGDVTVKYSYEGATSQLSYTTSAANWKEAGGGKYSLLIGASEFTATGKYEVEVVCTGCLTYNFPVEATTLTQEEVDLDSVYQNGIFVDGQNGVGTARPGLDGTQKQPVNSAASALTIAAALGLGYRHIVASSNDSDTITLASAPTGFLFESKFDGPNWATNIAFAPNSQNLTMSTIRRFYITGAFGAGAKSISFEDCVLGDLTNVAGRIKDCTIRGNISIIGGSGIDNVFEMINPRFGYSSDDTPELTMTGYTEVLIIHNMSGYFTLKDCDSKTVIVSGKGKVTIDSSCTSCTLIKYGNIEHEDNGTTSTIIKSGNSVAPENAYETWEEILTGATHNVATSAGKRLRELDDVSFIDSGTAQAGAATSITLKAGSSSLDNFYNHLMVIITAGVGIGQVRSIESYVGSSKIATIHKAWVTNPNASSEYSLIAFTSVHVEDIEPAAIEAAAFAADAIDANAVKTDVVISQVNQLGTQAKADVNAEADQSLIDYAGGGVANQNSVDSIQNNTNFGVSLPTYFLVPTSSANVYKMAVNFRDNSGEMEDPESNDIGLDLDTADGTDKNAILYKDFATTTALDASGIAGHLKLERTDVGRYFCYIKIASTETENQLIYNFALDEGVIRQYYNRSNTVLDAVPGEATLADNVANKDIIAESFKERDVSAISAVNGSNYKDIVTDRLDPINAKTSQLNFNGTHVNASMESIIGNITAALNVGLLALNGKGTDDKHLVSSDDGLATPADVLAQVNVALDAVSTELAALPDVDTASIREQLKAVLMVATNGKIETSTLQSLLKNSSGTFATRAIVENPTDVTVGKLT